MEYIHEERNVLPKTFCRELIEKFESDSRRGPGKLKSGVIDHMLKKYTDLSIELITGWGVETNRLKEVFNTAFTKYLNNLKLNIFGEEKASIVDQIFINPYTIRSGFQMKRHGVDELFKWHIDYAPFENRMCNFIFYLNDHEACTEFLNGKKIKPEPGKIAFFPTTWTYAHRGQPIEKGNKYVITGVIFYKKQVTQSLPFIVTHD
jgi:hypothetical protein|tara:strand:+ start:692 stop:1306 length:615 start_codon:yes stop_codon:yes gene_type:complete